MTFSIVARDAATGALGVATATAGPVVGSLVPHARAGIGAIATQAMTNPYLGFDGLDLLEDPAMDAETALSKLIECDVGRDRRQAIIIDRKGRTTAWTGVSCNPHAAAIAADGVAVAGNLIVGDDVLTAMLSGYSSDGDLADKLLAALRAGLAAGGDRRGVRSAALKVYTSELYPAVDLRADLSDAPIDHLAEILAATRDAGYADFFAKVMVRARPDQR